MIKKILRYFEANAAAESQPANAHDAVIVSLALLLEVAKADHHVEPEESQKIVDLAVTEFAFSKERRDELLQLAQDLSTQSTSLYEFTTLVNAHYSNQQKFQLIAAMWRVAFADGRIDRYEEHLIRRVADLIYVPHVQFIEAKLNAAALHNNQGSVNNKQAKTQEPK